MQTDAVDRPLRWLTIADTPANPDSGASGTDVQTVHALRALGHTVDDVWSDSLPHRLRHGNLHYALELPRAYRAVVQERLARAPYDVILASQPHAYLAARWVRANAPQVLFLNRSHGWEAHVEDALAPHRKRLGTPRWRFPRSLAGRPLAAWLRRHCQWAADACHGIVVSATGCCDYIVRTHGIDVQRVAVIPQAPPAEYLHGEPPPHSSRAPGSVLLVSTPSFFKGVDDALGIIQSSHEQQAGLAFTWVVDARHHDMLRARLGPPSRGSLTLRAPTDQRRLRDIYDGHRLFLFPSLFEGFGKAGVEAMSRGLCVVATAVGGMRDILVDGRSGYLHAAGDRSSMLSRLVEAARHPGVASEIGVCARKAVQHLTWLGHAKQLAHFAHRLRAQLVPCVD